MRNLALATLMIGATLSPQLFAQETNDLNYNVVNIQADASRQVANDEMQAVLYIEKSNKQPAELSNQINQLMNQAQAIARKYPQVKVETGAQSTYPIYDNDSRKLKEWRARAEIQLESKDFKAASQLISELQQNFQTQSINFTVSDEQRKKVENELMIEASKNFQQRAQAITQAWNKAQYNLGVFYESGEFIEQNIEKALEWFEKSANQNNSKAQYNLAVMYVNGSGIEKDLSKAKLWTQKAIDIQLPWEKYFLKIVLI